jgi:hypothetical protein
MKIKGVLRVMIKPPWIAGSLPLLSISRALPQTIFGVNQK